MVLSSMRGAVVVIVQFASGKVDPCHALVKASFAVSSCTYTQMLVELVGTNIMIAIKLENFYEYLVSLAQE